MEINKIPDFPEKCTVNPEQIGGLMLTKNGFLIFTTDEKKPLWGGILKSFLKDNDVLHIHVGERVVSLPYSEELINFLRGE